MTRIVASNGLAGNLEGWQKTQRESAQRYAEKRRAVVEVTRQGERTVARRKPIKAVSDRRRVENKVRRAMADARWPDGPPKCVVPWCPNRADDLHEVLSRARGGSITDEGNTVPLFRGCHTVITYTEPQWAYEFGLLKHSWEVSA